MYIQVKLSTIHYSLFIKTLQFLHLIFKLYLTKNYVTCKNYKIVYNKILISSIIIYHVIYMYQVVLMVLKQLYRTEYIKITILNK